MQVYSPTGDPKDTVFYQYVPSDVAAYIFVALFGIMTCLHIGYMIYLRSRFFIPLIIGRICEIFGYYGRAWSHLDPKSIEPWVMQSLLLFGAPPFLAATIYMAFKRIIISLDASQHSFTSPRWISKIYVFVNIICFCSQVAGIGIQATGDAQIISIGGKVVLAGLILQLVSFATLILVAWKVQCGLDRESTRQSSKSTVNWKRYIIALYVVSLAILVRSLVRAIEFAQGPLDTINSSDVYIYVFDALMMFVVVVMFLVLHPGCLIKDTRVYQKKGIPSVELGDRLLDT